MAALFQIIPATPAEMAEMLCLEQLCYFAPWTKRIVRTYVVTDRETGIDPVGVVVVNRIRWLVRASVVRYSQFARLL
jgi:hypothetical protein